MAIKGSTDASYNYVICMPIYCIMHLKAVGAYVNTVLTVERPAQEPQIVLLLP